ncbi:hypothetical protein GS575_12070 [Rhodococcus hoagii]|nr:hypothetical protein [Prescottella equi]
MSIWWTGFHRHNEPSYLAVGLDEGEFGDPVFDQLGGLCRSGFARPEPCRRAVSNPASIPAFASAFARMPFTSTNTTTLLEHDKVVNGLLRVFAVRDFWVHRGARSLQQGEVSADVLLE